MNRPIVKGEPLSYQEIFRILGAYLDSHHMQEARVLEAAETFILQGLATRGKYSGERVTYQLTEDDILELYLDATAKRGKRIHT
jgi:hypothetical protein